MNIKKENETMASRLDIKGVMAALVFALSCAAYALPTVSDVMAQQRWPCGYTVTDFGAELAEVR